MKAAFNQAVHDPSLIFLFLACLELVWNVCRSILTCISARYYLEIIKEVRQITTIRLSDFTDSASSEYEQEFHEEMMNEYPGYGHKDNVMWYCSKTASYNITILLDIMAGFAVYFQSYFLLLAWMCVYLSFSIFEVIATIFIMRKCTNESYFRKKWGRCALTLLGCVAFRCYLVWLSQGLPFTSAN